MSDFRFSVVIATYNRLQYALEAVRSVVEQTCPAHEIIVVCDGSTDGTAEALRAAFPQVLVMEQPNLGRAVARNRGVARATGEWVCFLDDDDLWHRELLEEAARHIASRADCMALRSWFWLFADAEDGPRGGFGLGRDFVAAGLAACHERAETTASKNDLTYLNVEGRTRELMLERYRGVTSTSLVRRDIFIAAGGFCPMQTCGEDWTMHVNVARLAEWHTLERRLGFVRLHGGQSSYDASNGLAVVAGYVNAWFTGRPMAGRAEFPAIVKNLARYGSCYRGMVQGFFWQAIRSMAWRVAARIWWMGLCVLPRWRDRMYVLLPPQVTWRFERHVLGRHK